MKKEKATKEQARAQWRATAGINVPHPSEGGAELRIEENETIDGRLTPEQIEHLLAFHPGVLAEA